ncbi:MAG: major capsid protein [Microviridae sp.]|nr:MAG: major capsid protein [Microviridae sp.]
MNQVTLGGDRLGSGKKQKVDLHGFERSTHDLSYIWRSTMSAGTLVPFMTEVALPGDTFDIDLNCDIKTHPTIGPLFGSYKVQLDVFHAPMRLYHSALHNNRLGIGMNMSQIKLPKFSLVAKLPNAQAYENLDNYQINPSCIFSYLGIRGVGIPSSDALDAVIYRKFNAIPYLAYFEIYKQYYANKMEEEGVIIHTDATINEAWVASVTINGNLVTQNSTFPTNWEATTGTVAVLVNVGEGFYPWQVLCYMIDGSIITLDQLVGGRWIDSGLTFFGTVASQYNGVGIKWWSYMTQNQSAMFPVRLERFNLGLIDEMRDTILASAWNDELDITSLSAYPYYYALQSDSSDTPNPITSASFTQEGLLVKTYQSDLFNNWLNTEWIDGTGGINDITAVSTAGDEFTIDALNLAQKVYEMLNRIAVSGGTYDDWLGAVYDHESFTRAEMPVYHGGLIRELVFQEVVSNAQNADQPLGTLAGKGVMSSKHKGGKVVIRVDEPSYIMGIISLTPRLDYSQGNKWDVNLDTLDDLHKPGLDQIGFQELITEQMAWWTTNQLVATENWLTKSAGKQPAWINYMTNVNQTRGNFAIQDNEMFMTLNRKYEAANNDAYDLYIEDLTTYIDPAKFNSIFADTSLDSQNFWAQISVDITARRKMSAKIMPNL